MLSISVLDSLIKFNSKEGVVYPQSEGAYVSGWSLLGPAVLPMIHRDVTHIFVPMGAILLAMLIIVFRDTRDVILVSNCLATPMLVVIACMKMIGIDWNMLNIIAIPLLLGGHP